MSMNDSWFRDTGPTVSFPLSNNNITEFAIAILINLALFLILTNERCFFVICFPHLDCSNLKCYSTKGCWN